MAVYKESGGAWRVIYRYTDWKGERKQTSKRGFVTKRDALAWEREQLNKVEADLDMTFGSFVEVYTADMQSRIKENTWETKEHIIRSKLLPYFGNRKICEIQPKEIIAWQNAATLELSGRDQQDQRLHLNRDVERLVWELERAETELWKAPSDPVLEAVAVLLTADRPSWVGTPTELVQTLQLDIRPNTLTLRLNVNAGRLLNEYNIQYESSRNRTGRRVELALVPAQV